MPIHIILVLTYNRTNAMSAQTFSLGPPRCQSLQYLNLLNPCGTTYNARVRCDDFLYPRRLPSWHDNLSLRYDTGCVLHNCLPRRPPHILITFRSQPLFSPVESQGPDYTSSCRRPDDLNMRDPTNVTAFEINLLQHECLRPV